MKKLIILFLVLCCCACSAPVDPVETKEPEPTPEVVINLPTKEIAESTKMSESPITPKNLDMYMFRDDCVYLDTRYPYQFYQEGAIAGFLNLPFYEYIADFNKDANALYTITKIKNEDGSTIYPGDPDSFIANYEESEDLIYDLNPKEKNILVIATAGVESCYFLNLLIQLGYDPARLYNVGSFTTGMGEDIAYRTYSDAKYLIEPMELYETSISYHWNHLTPIKK
jgi:rhodanese-related sulfurtransferase